MKEQPGCLDGTTLEYVYEELGTVRVAYAAGEVAFEWIGGPMAGEKGSGFAYRAMAVGADAYFVTWHEPELPGLVTLYIDLDAGRIASSVLAMYGTEQEQRLFESATILRVEGRD